MLTIYTALEVWVALTSSALRLLSPLNKCCQDSCQIESCVACCLCACVCSCMLVIYLVIYSQRCISCAGAKPSTSMLWRPIAGMFSADHVLSLRLHASSVEPQWKLSHLTLSFKVLLVHNYVCFAILKEEQVGSIIKILWLLWSNRPNWLPSNKTIVSLSPQGGLVLNTWSLWLTRRLQDQQDWCSCGLKNMVLLISTLKILMKFSSSQILEWNGVLPLLAVSVSCILSLPLKPFHCSQFCSHQSSCRACGYVYHRAYNR